MNSTLLRCSESDSPKISSLNMHRYTFLGLNLSPKRFKGFESISFYRNLVKNPFRFSILLIEQEHPYIFRTPTPPPLFSFLGSLKLGDPNLSSACSLQGRRPCGPRADIWFRFTGLYSLETWFAGLHSLETRFTGLYSLQTRFTGLYSLQTRFTGLYSLPYFNLGTNRSTFLVSVTEL